MMIQRTTEIALCVIKCQIRVIKVNYEPTSVQQKPIKSGNDSRLMECKAWHLVNCTPAFTNSQGVMSQNT